MSGNLDAAIQALRAGQLVAFPTDTVYGVGVAVRHASSPKLIYQAKGRDAGKPVAWLVDGPEAIDAYGADVPQEARALARKHWPGALTIVVKAGPAVPAAFQSQAGTIGLRMPDDPTALALVRAVGPVATSSANRSGGADAASAEALDERLKGACAVVVAGSERPSGTASTVIDCSQGKIIIVRQGGIMADTTFTVPFNFTSHDGKTKINAKLWTNMSFGSPDSPGTETPKAVVQIVHGMSEYIDRYDELARYLVNRGFVVCAEDHIGHGGSAATVEDRGHMPAHGGKDILVRDVHTLHRMVADCFPGVPYVMYGHSMGSFITRVYISRYGDELAACVLSGTGNVPAQLSKFGRTLARMLASIRGETYRSAFIDSMGAGGYGKQIENARTPLDWLSNDDAVVDAYIADDLCGFMFTVGGYATLLDMTAEVVTPECAAKVPKGLPVFLVAGDGDPVGDMGKGVRAAAQLLSDAGVQRVDVKIYPGMRHEIHNEFDRDQVYDDIATWIEGAVS